MTCLVLITKLNVQSENVFIAGLAAIKLRRLNRNVPNNGKTKKIS